MNKFFLRKEAGWNPLDGMGRRLGDYLYNTFSRHPYKNGFDPRSNPQQYAQDIYDMAEARSNRLLARTSALMAYGEKMRDIARNSAYVTPEDRYYLDDLYHRSTNPLIQSSYSRSAQHNVIGEPGTIRRAIAEENIANRRPISFTPVGPRRIWANWEGLDSNRRNK